MKAIVIYESNTGFTRQYAEWIADSIGCPCRAVKETGAQELTGIDTVIFGGWVMGNNIVGLDKIKKLAAPAIVFAVGASEPEEAITAAILGQNQLGDAAFFYLQGGFRFDKLSFLQRSMLKMVKKTVEKKENPTKQDLDMAQMLGTSFDCADRRPFADR